MGPVPIPESERLRAYQAERIESYRTGENLNGKSIDKIAEEMAEIAAKNPLVLNPSYEHTPSPDGRVLGDCAAYLARKQELAKRQEKLSDYDRMKKEEDAARRLVLRTIVAEPKG